MPEAARILEFTEASGLSATLNDPLRLRLPDQHSSHPGGGTISPGRMRKGYAMQVTWHGETLEAAEQAMAKFRQNMEALRTESED